MALPTIGAAIPERTVRKTNGKARVMLTNAYGPYPPKWGKSVSDLLGARLARDNNMDGRVILHSWPLYILAENITNPCTVLEFPNWDDFIAEVRKGYDVIGIQLISMHMARVARMMRAIRELSPETEILIGGYGVGMLHEPLPGDKNGEAEYVRTHADHICRGEGVRFMRELLGDTPVDRPITQYHVPPAEVKVSRFDNLILSLPAILVSLGCPAACEFCNTSAFFHHKKIRVATAAQVYDFMKAHQRKLMRDNITFILFDEDIFMDPEFVRELGRLIRSDRRTWGFRWISFGSMSTVSQFTPRELRECGVEGIWIGVESGITAEDNRNKTGYTKREGLTSPEKLFPELTRVGIQVIGSMILGFDFHTPDNIERDIDYFVSLKPTLYQVGPFRPCPGTKLYDRLTQEERINDVFDWEDIHLWEVGSFKLKNLTDEQLKHYFDLAHDKLRTINGPPLLQIFECALQSHLTFRDSDSEFLRFQAEDDLTRVRLIRVVIRAIEMEAPSPAVKQRAKDLLERSLRVLPKGPLAFVRKAYSAVAPHFISDLGIICVYQPEMERRQKTAVQPPKRWTYYNRSGEKAPLTCEGSHRGRRRFRGELGRMRELAKRAAATAPLVGTLVRSGA